MTHIATLIALLPLLPWYCGAAASNENPHCHSYMLASIMLQLAITPQVSPTLPGVTVTVKLAMWVTPEG